MFAKNLAHSALLRTQSLAGVPAVGRAWRKARFVCESQWGPDLVETKLHGSTACLEFSAPYPYLIRRFPNFNAPQVELVAATADVLGRRVTVVDVGAGVGDTALLLLERCDQAIASLECIEGEPKCAAVLRRNLTDPRGSVREVVLSDVPGLVPSLVRTEHESAASARGAQLVSASTLDVELPRMKPDVLKIDAEGYDGKILAGARELLGRARPAILFEWNPQICRAVRTESRLAFDVLRQAGYSRWIFFTKYGTFSHFGDGCLEQLETLWLTSRTLREWHYDVIALHESSPLDEIAIADLRHWGSSGYP